MYRVDEQGWYLDFYCMNIAYEFKEYDKRWPYTYYENNSECEPQVLKRKNQLNFEAHSASFQEHARP